MATASAVVAPAASCLRHHRGLAASSLSSCQDVERRLERSTGKCGKARGEPARVVHGQTTIGSETLGPRRAGLIALLSFRSVVTSNALQDDRATMRPLQRQVKPITSRRPGTNCPLRRSGAHPANIQEKAPFPDISAAKCATDGKELAIDMHARGPSVTSPFLVTAPFMVTNDSRPSRSLRSETRQEQTF